MYRLRKNWSTCSENAFTYDGLCLCLCLCLETSSPHTSTKHHRQFQELNISALQSFPGHPPWFHVQAMWIHLVSPVFGRSSRQSCASLCLDESSAGQGFCDLSRFIKSWKAKMSKPGGPRCTLCFFLGLLLDSKHAWSAGC